MSTKRQKQEALEARRAERDALAEARAAEVRRKADARARRRAQREAEQERRVKTLQAMRVMRPPSA